MDAKKSAGTPQPDTEVSQVSRRVVEARFLLEFYTTLKQRLGEDEALACVAETTARMAREAGAAFAAACPGEPGLEHFSTILDVWSAGGALDIGDVTLEDGGLSFDVLRCGYYEAYRELGLPEELIRALSCDRDPHFAAGYDPRLVLERSGCIACGRDRCDFRFHWQDGE